MLNQRTQHRSARLSTEEPQTYGAEAQCQQPKQRQSDCLATAATVIEMFYDLTHECDWMIGTVTIILFYFNSSGMTRQLLLTVGGDGVHSSYFMSFKGIAQLCSHCALPTIIQILYSLGI